MTSSILFSLKISLVIQDFLWSFMNFRISSNSENIIAILIGGTLNLYIILGSNNIFNNIKGNDDIIYFEILLWKLKELIYAKHLEQILATVKCCI